MFDLCQRLSHALLRNEKLVTGVKKALVRGSWVVDRETLFVARGS